MSTHEDDRAAYLAGEERQSLPPQERAELDELRTLLGSPATWAVPEPALEDRVVAAIAEQAAARPAGARERKAPSRVRVRWPRPAFALGGLAAAAAAAAIAVAVTTSGGSPAPERFAMVVSGTALAPGASGSATLTKTGSGWRIELAATGLTRLGNGRYYEAWLKSPAGVMRAKPHAVAVDEAPDRSTVGGRQDRSTEHQVLRRLENGVEQPVEVGALVVGEPASGAHVLADRHTAANEYVLERRMARKTVDLRAQRPRVDVLAAHCGGDDLRERGGQRGDRSGGTPRAPGRSTPRSRRRRRAPR